MQEKIRGAELISDVIFCVSTLFHQLNELLTISILDERIELCSPNCYQYFSSTHQKTIIVIYLNTNQKQSIILIFFYNLHLMEKEEQTKGNIIDLIFNHQHPIQDHQGLIAQCYMSGNVFLGNKKAVDQQYIGENMIGAVLTIMDNKSYQKIGIKSKIQALGLLENHLFMDVVDNKNVKIIHLFAQVHEFFDKCLREELNVLIHCKGGMSRSPAFLCSYIMKKFGLSAYETMALVKQRRNVVGINQGFVNQLKLYENQLKEQKKN